MTAMLTALGHLFGDDATMMAQPSAAAAGAAAVRRACAVTRRRRVILSGSLHPGHVATITAELSPDGIEIESLAPDPLGIEDLVGRIDEDLAALVIQTPDPFGARRGLGLAATLCREVGALPVAVLADAAIVGLDGPPDADIVVIDGRSAVLGLTTPLGLLSGRADVIAGTGTAATALTRDFLAALARLGEAGLAARAAEAQANADRLRGYLAGLTGARVIARDHFAAILLYLGDSRDAEAAVERLAGPTRVLPLLPLGRVYPGWPELHPGLVIGGTARIDAQTLDGLAAGLIARSA